MNTWIYGLYLAKKINAMYASCIEVNEPKLVSKGGLQDISLYWGFTNGKTVLILNKNTLSVILHIHIGGTTTYPVRFLILLQKEY